MKSTSLNRLSADYRLPKWKRKYWFLVNRLNNGFLPHAKSKNLSLLPFSPQLKEAYWSALDPKSSPSRSLSDLFWMTLPWGDIQTELGEIRALDTGCGSGNFAVRLQNYANKNINSYLGLDMDEHPDWPGLMQQHSFLRLDKADSKEFSKKISQDTNLFLSQSAIEHFQQDLTYFRQIKEFIDAKDTPVIQIHLFPSAACLKLYRLHGVRQYTPHTVSKISSIFEGNSYSKLYNLGGPISNQLHWEFITRPLHFEGAEDGRDRRYEDYRSRLRPALEKDMQSQTVAEASFYALVIHSNQNNHIFQAP